MDDVRFAILYRKYLDRTISETEMEEFLLLVAEPGSISVLQSFGIPEVELIELNEAASARILDDILKKKSDSDQKPYEKRFTKLRLKQIAAVAAVICFCFLAGLFVFTKNRRSAPLASANIVLKDASPGQNGAVLTLSNGQRYVIDASTDGKLAKGIVRSGAGLSVSGESGVPYATLKTPFGRQQRLRLSDGTVVWLNAGSSIRFPTAFNGRERKVEVTGEAYFEVVHNSKKPFFVVAGKEMIQDLGTHFDVNAYGDDGGVKTTLIEGSVQIGKTVLNPGEQYLNGNVKKINASGSIAWVTGFFQFENADIRTVMNQLSRWYNVEVHYEGNIPPQVFEGEMQRTLKLSQVLNLLTGTGIHYTLNGNQLTIRP